MQAGNASGRRIERRGGWALAVAGCLLVIAPAVVALRILGSLWSGPTPGMTDTLINQGMTEHVEQWHARVRAGDGLSGVVFGDSVFTPMFGDKNFAGAFEAALQTAGLDVTILNLSFPGFTAFQFYYFVDRVLAAGPPDFAVVEVNLRTFAPDWWKEPAQRLQALAVGLSPPQVWRVHRALATQEVGFLTPFRHRLGERLGIVQLVDAVRTRGLGVLDAVGDGANRALGLAVRPRDDLNRQELGRHMLLNRHRALAWYGQDFVASPMAAVLCAFNETLRAAGVTTVYVLAPVQQRRLEGYGITPADLHVRTEQLRQMLGVPPDRWIDATELFQTSDFSDGMHVHPDRIRRMTRPVVEQLVPLLLSRQHAGCTPPEKTRLQSRRHGAVDSRSAIRPDRGVTRDTGPMGMSHPDARRSSRSAPTVA